MLLTAYVIYLVVLLYLAERKRERPSASDMLKEAAVGQSGYMRAREDLINLLIEAVRRARRQDGDDGHVETDRGGEK